MSLKVQAQPNPAKPFNFYPIRRENTGGQETYSAESTDGFIPGIAFEAYLKLSAITASSNGHGFPIKPGGIALWSGKGLAKSFEGKDTELASKVQPFMPDPNAFKVGEAIVVNNVAAVRLQYGRHAVWEALSLNGDEISQEERERIETTFDLRFRIPEIESYAIPITTRTFKGLSDDVYKKISAKLPAPKTTDKKEFDLPSGRKLYLRMNKSYRSWVAIPENKIALSDEERKEIEDFFGLEFKYKLPSVDRGDIVCWGQDAGKYFEGFKRTVAAQLIKKLPDPETFAENTKELERDGIKITFTKKVSRGGNLVWTVSKNKHKDAAYVLELERKIKLLPVPKDAIICWGKFAALFWKEAASDKDGTQRFNYKIRKHLPEPKGFVKETDQNKAILRGEHKKKCTVYVGKNEEGYFFWYVKKEEREIFSEITGLTPETFFEVPVTARDNNGRGHTAETHELEIPMGRYCKPRHVRLRSH